MIDPEKDDFLAHLERKRKITDINTRRKRQVKDPEPEIEVFSIDANNQEACAACSAFSVAAAMDTCWFKAMSENQEDAFDYKNSLSYSAAVRPVYTYTSYPFYPVYYLTSSTTQVRPSDPSFPVAPPGGFSTSWIVLLIRT